MNSSKKVIGNSIIYTVNNMLLKAFNFFLLPLYTAYLTTAEYGITNLVNSFNSVACYVIAFSLYSAVIRFYADYKEDKEQVRIFLGTIVCFIIGSGIVFFLVALLFKDLLEKYIFLGIPFVPTILMALVSVVCLCLYTLYQDILKGMQLAKKSAIVTLIYFFIHIGLSIFFVVNCRWGANGVILAGLIVNFLFTVFMLIDLRYRKLIRFCLNVMMLKEALKYSIPLIPHNLSTNITELVSKIFINKSGSLSTVGLYSLASQFGTISDLMQSSVNVAFQPWFFEQMNKKKKNFKRNIVELSDLLLWIYGFLFIGLGLFAQEVILLMLSDEYRTAWTVVPFIIITYTIKIPYYFYINILFYYKEATKYIFSATLTGSMINLYLSYQLIPLYGMYGSVVSDAISMIVRVGIIVMLSYKYGNLGYKISKFIWMSLLITGAIFAGLFFSYTYYNDTLSLENFFYKCMIVCLYTFIALLFNKKRIRELIVQRK